MHEELSLNVLSEVASLAPAYISTLFGEVMRESFTEYVTRASLDKAASLLRDDVSLSVTEIASLVGYRNPQYFHNKFKTRFGVTPVQYRNAKNADLTSNLADSFSISLCRLFFLCEAIYRGFIKENAIRTERILRKLNNITIEKTLSTV